MLECLIAVICIFILSPGYPTVFSTSMTGINLVRITKNLAKTPSFLHCSSSHLYYHNSQNCIWTELCCLVSIQI